METRYCTSCGRPIKSTEFIGQDGRCGECTALNPSGAKSGKYSERDWLVTLLFSIFLGYLGIHRFYVGKIGTGILWLLTGGCLGIGALVAIIMIATETFTDDQNKRVVQDQRKNPRPAYAYADSTATKAPREDVLDQLEKLAKLRDSGAIAQAEYEEKKAVLMAKIN